MVDSTTTKRAAGRPKNPIPRSELLAKAASAFAELGYAGASMNEIAERAGLRKASLFHHFQSKEALYTEVLSSTIEDLGRLVMDADLGEGDFPSRLDRLGDLVSTYLGHNVHAARLLMREMVEKNSFARAGVGEQVLTILAVTAMFLESGMESGDLPRQDPRQLAMSIVGLHLTYFAAAEIASELMGKEVFSDEQIAARSAAVRAHVRRLCAARETPTGEEDDR